MHKTSLDCFNTCICEPCSLVFYSHHSAILRPCPFALRPSLLTASGGANAVNSGAAESAGAAAAGGKAKVKAADGVKPKAAAAKKRGLKRL